ncbi:zinc-binding protein A33-like [Rhinoraja longicauda]
MKYRCQCGVLAVSAVWLIRHRSLMIFTPRSLMPFTISTSTCLMLTWAYPPLRLLVECLPQSAGREHKSHSFMPVKEAVENHKDQVKSSIQSLTKDKSGIQQMEQQQKEKISGVLEQSHNLQSKITSQFAELHQVLTKKEQRVLADIREEEKRILKRMKKNLGEIEENLKSIQEEL